MPAQTCKQLCRAGVDAHLLASSNSSSHAPMSSRTAVPSSYTSSGRGAFFWTSWLRGRPTFLGPRHMCMQHPQKKSLTTPGHTNEYGRSACRDQGIRDSTQGNLQEVEPYVIVVLFIKGSPSEMVPQSNMYY